MKTTMYSFLYCCYMSLSTIYSYWKCCHENTTVCSFCVVVLYMSMSTIKSIVLPWKCIVLSNYMLPSKI